MASSRSHAKISGFRAVLFTIGARLTQKFANQAEEVREIEIGIIAEDRMAEAIIVHRDMAMVRFYLQSRNRKYIQKVQTELHDPSKDLADLLRLDDEE